MELPALLLVHTITVEPYRGRTGAGDPVYGAAVDIACLVERGRKLLRVGPGEQVATVATAFIPYAHLASVPTRSRVLLPGDSTTCTIHQSTPIEAGNLPIPRHIEIVLV